MIKKAAAPFFAILLAASSLPAQAVEKEERGWQDEAVYFIMIDRFNNGETKNDFNVNTSDPRAYHGGDFAGIIDKLDYIKGMGFTAIWMTPVFDNEVGGYHGYWINDFYKTEEHFGTINEFKELVKEAHKRDIKIILDFVVNHVGPNHPWQNDPEKAGWFHEKKPIINWNSQEELENNWLYDLPDFNQDQPEARQYLLDAAKWWINETGIDGYRLDTVRHVPVSFWEEFSREVKAQRDGFYLLGEVWSNDPSYIADYNKAGIDGFVDFPQHEQLKEAFVKPEQTLAWLFSTVQRNKAIYEDPFLMGNFIDNHDVDRFTRDILQAKQDPVTRWKLALTYMYTTPGIPIVYYGSEVALDGGNDPDNRRQMDFTGDKELTDYITKLGELRRHYPALRRGTMEKLYEKGGMAVYKRHYENQTAVIAINNTSETQSVMINPDQIGANKELKGLIGDKSVTEEKDGYKIALGQDKAEIYELTEESGPNLLYVAGAAAVILAFGLLLFLFSKRLRKKNLNE